MIERLRRQCPYALTALAVVLLSADSETASGQEKSWRLFRREERTLNLPDPPPLPRFDSADVPPTATVADLSKNAAPQTLGLDDAIRIALANTRAIRILAGTTAVNSGATIYDPAIAATAIEEAKGRFDPNLNINNTFARQSQPGAGFVQLADQMPQAIIFLAGEVGVECVGLDEIHAGRRTRLGCRSDRWTIAIRIWRMVDARQQRTEAAALDHLARRERERSHASTVEAAR